MYKQISIRHGHEHFELWPHLIFISLYKQLAPHLKVGLHKSNTVCDFDTIWAVTAAIIVQLDTLPILSTFPITSALKLLVILSYL